MLKIALLQISSHGFDQKANMEKGAEACVKARNTGADIALFPEMWNIGYAHYDQMARGSKNLKSTAKIRNWQQQAITNKSEFICYYQRLAKKLNMAIAITYLEKHAPAPRNTVSLIDRHGKIVLTYAKVHTCDFSLEAACTSGNKFSVCELGTKKGKVKIGAMICFDREFPESARILMLKGAEIILTPNACELEQNRIAQIRTRAFENMVGIAVANYPSPAANGHSLAFDGIAFNKKGSRDHLIIDAPQKEGVYMANFNLKKMREYRSRESWGNAYRKPKNYGLLVGESINAPFIRKDARR
ncbi:MAG: hypothetical protein ACD_21C00083G0008 [uncultured bacterium]|nr:MAG: hypothetical protein ACD_21C00083G0008 [uncultured bacterium]